MIYKDVEIGNYFADLNAINVNDKIEKKNGLSYLSWAYAWGELKKKFPDSTYTIYENADGWNYFTDGRTAWVKTGVTVCGVEHIEELPIMDFENKSIPLDHITSFEVNKAIQRSLTKAVARHGLGLYIYAGEDLPDEGDGKRKPDSKKKSDDNLPFEIETEKTAREQLREFCKENQIEQKTIIQMCGLSSVSTDKDYQDALDYARKTFG